MKVGELNKEELDLCRQWFDAVLDETPEYLGPRDYELARKIHIALGLRAPKANHG